MLGAVSLYALIANAEWRVSVGQTVENPSKTSLSDRERATQFVNWLTSHQRDLYTYINTMLLGDSAAVDVLQDTNLDLWAHVDDFDFNRPFLPWAYTFAFHRVLAFRKSSRHRAWCLATKPWN